ncbi:MAG: flagellar hook-associated protein FlgL [Hydrogenovibrio sp.]|nr:flagellar hook-associated protein FlgL [Hydrogenovibrio sp.]
MRVSTSQFYSQSYSAIAKHQNSVMQIQEQISSGKRVNRPSDDPVATSQINSLNKTIDSLAQFKKNGDYARSQLSLEETQITSAVDAVQRARELSLQMMNDTYSAKDRQSTAKEVGQLIDHLSSLMNSTNSEGELIFAGNNVNANEAFVVDAANSAGLQPGNQFLAYIGSANAGAAYDVQANYGARFVQIGFDANHKANADDKGDASRVRITDKGSSVFNIPGATSLPAGVDPNLVNVLVQLKDTLDQGLQPSAAIGDDLQAGIKQMAKQLAEIGGRQNRIDSQATASDSYSITIKERLSNLQDLDMVKGITDLTTKQNALQAAQQVFSKVQGMSLFNYLK